MVNRDCSIIRNRVEWIDLAKAIAIMLMVIGHSNVPLYIDKWIHSFHMPLFFLVSGFLFVPDKYSCKSFLRIKTKLLFIPYFFWGGIICLFSNVIPYDGFPTQNPLQILIHGSGFGIWFLAILFCVEFIWILLVNFSKRFILRKFLDLTILFISLLGFFFDRWGILFPYRLEIVPMGLLFYYLGICLKKYSNGKINQINIYLVGFLFLLQMQLSIQQTPFLDMYYNHWGEGLSTIFTSLLGIYVLIQLSIIIQNKVNRRIKVPLLWLGKNTIVVVCCSQLYMIILKFLFDNIGIPNLIGWPIRFFLMWVLLIGTTITFTKYAPILIGKKH